LQKQLLELGKLYTYGQAVSCLKACLEILDVCCDYSTSLLLLLNNQVKEELKALLAEHKLI